MDESLRDFMYLEILGEAPHNSEVEFTQLELEVAREVERLNNLLSLDLPGSSEGYFNYALPASTYSHPVPFAGDEQSGEEQLQEPSGEPKGRKPRGQGQKRKAEDEKAPRKRHRPEPRQSRYMADPANPASPGNHENQGNLPYKAHLANLPFQANQGNLPYQANPPYQANQGNPPNQAKLPYPASLANLANSAPDTSSFNPVPPPRPIIPEYITKYTTVVSVEQRDRYVEDIMAASDKSSFLYGHIRRNLQHFFLREQQLRFMFLGSESYQEMCDLMRRELLNAVQHQPGYILDCNRYFYLQRMQAHIFRLVDEFDLSHGQSDI